MSTRVERDARRLERFGEGVKGPIAQSKEKVKNWTKTDWEQSGNAFAAICGEATLLLERRLPADSPEVQAVIHRHYEWLKQFWMPNSESYAGYSLLIEESELGKAYEAYHPQLPHFMAAATMSSMRRCS